MLKGDPVVAVEGSQREIESLGYFFSSQTALGCIISDKGGKSTHIVQTLV